MATIFGGALPPLWEGSKEIPAGIIKLAEERFQEIQSAYAVVVESRS